MQDFRNFMDDQYEAGPEVQRASDRVEAALSMLPKHKRLALEELIAQLVYATAEEFFQLGKEKGAAPDQGKAAHTKIPMSAF